MLMHALGRVGIVVLYGPKQARRGSLRFLPKDLDIFYASVLVISNYRYS